MDPSESEVGDETIVYAKLASVDESSRSLQYDKVQLVFGPDAVDVCKADTPTQPDSCDSVRFWPKNENPQLRTAAFASDAHFFEMGEAGAAAYPVTMQQFFSDRHPGATLRLILDKPDGNVLEIGPCYCQPNAG